MWKVFAFLVAILATSSAADCPFPGLPKNGFGALPLSVAESSDMLAFNVGDQIYFHCNSEYAMSSTDTAALTCQGDGSWSGPIPMCLKRILCTDWERNIFRAGSPGPASSEATECGRFSKVVLQPRNEIVRISDVAEIRIALCGEDAGEFLVRLVGSNSDEAFQCQRSRTEHANTAVFTCSIDTVDDNIKWVEITAPEAFISPQYINLLTDSGDNCGSPGVPLNGTIEFVSEDRYRYECDEGFVMHGNEEVTCDPGTGRWSPMPMCKEPEYLRDRCAFPPAIDNGEMQLVSSYRYQYICGDGFVLNGSGSVVCNPRTGQWGPVPTCERGADPAITVAEMPVAILQRNLGTAV